jgi:tetratricopeptide (TPR) repeat protein
MELDTKAKFWFEEYYLIGKDYEGLKRLPDAIKAYEESVKLEPAYPDSNFALGIAYIQVGDRTAALKQYNVLKQLDSKMAVKLREAIKE